MLTSSFPLRKFLDTFVPGFILQIGIWYIYRPYLLQYFPNIAFDDPSNQKFSSELKLIVFLIIAISLGIIINHISDIAIELNYIATSSQRKSLNWIKKIAKNIFLAFTFTKGKDERVATVRRYLKSARKTEFLKMCKEWAWVDESKLSSDVEVIIVHQHICSRIRIISKQTELLYESFFAEVAFVSSLFTTFFLLLFLSVISIPITI